MAISIWMNYVELFSRKSINQISIEDRRDLSEIKY